MPYKNKEDRKRNYELNKEATNAKRKIYRQNNSEKIKQQKKERYILKDKETIKIYQEKNKEYLNTKAKEWREKNVDELKKNQKKYSKENRGLINKRVKLRKSIDPIFRLRVAISVSITKKFKAANYDKPCKTQEILGCTFSEFKTYIESKFLPWMSWENRGNPKDGILELNKTWDVDHIIPLSTAKTIEDVIRLNHYTNLQPLCSYTNRFIKRG